MSGARPWRAASPLLATPASARVPTRHVENVRHLLLLLAAGLAGAQTNEPGLLFHLSGDHGLTAYYAAGGDPTPNFADTEAKVIAGGPHGSYIQCGGHQILSYWAPGNICAQRGTPAFYWRAPRGRQPGAWCFATVRGARWRRPQCRC